MSETTRLWIHIGVEEIRFVKISPSNGSLLIRDVNSNLVRHTRSTRTWLAPEHRDTIKKRFWNAENQRFGSTNFKEHSTPRLRNPPLRSGSSKRSLLTGWPARRTATAAGRTEVGDSSCGPLPAVPGTGFRAAGRPRCWPGRGGRAWATAPTQRGRSTGEGPSAGGGEGRTRSRMRSAGAVREPPRRRTPRRCRQGRWSETCVRCAVGCSAPAFLCSERERHVRCRWIFLIFLSRFYFLWDEDQRRATHQFIQ